MNQRGRRTATRKPEASGGNALFTLGLVSVIALLIVGWVMQGGMESLSGKAKELGKISLGGGSQTVENPVAYSESNQSMTSVAVENKQAQPAVNTQSQADVQLVNEKWQTKLDQERQEYQRQLEMVKTNYESQIKDLEMKMKILQLENKTLRGNS